jgi:hypothetical protein
MAGPILYSANPWFATDIALKYRGGNYFALVSEYFDAERAPAGSAGSLIAPSSNPRKIYYDLLKDCDGEEQHSRIITDHKKTFRRLAKGWLGSGDITPVQFDEIVASVNATSWKIWRPVLYVIPRSQILPVHRIKEVKRADRAGYGPELQITDLQRHEFDIIDLSSLVPR